MAIIFVTIVTCCLKKVVYSTDRERSPRLFLWSFSALVASLFFTYFPCMFFPACAGLFLLNWELCIVCRSACEWQRLFVFLCGLEINGWKPHLSRLGWATEVVIKKSGWMDILFLSIQCNSIYLFFINLKNPKRAGDWPSFQIWKRTQHQLTVGHRVTKCYSTSAISAEVLTAQWTLFCQLQCDTVLVKFREVLRILQPEMPVLQKMVSRIGFH